MKKDFIKIIQGSVIISTVGVFVVDYFSHLFLSKPMETTPYFLTKFSLYLIYSMIFLSFINLKNKEFIKVLIGGIIVSSIWGTYYNVLPIIFDFYPFGIPLEGLTFLNMGLVGTGFAFGVVHTVAFLLGYYSKKLLLK